VATLSRNSRLHSLFLIGPLTKFRRAVGLLLIEAPVCRQQTSDYDHQIRGGGVLRTADDLTGVRPRGLVGPDPREMPDLHVASLLGVSRALYHFKWYAISQERSSVRNC
jgi:hypothetical protein